MTIPWKALGRFLGGAVLDAVLAKLRGSKTRTTPAGDVDTKDAAPREARATLPPPVDPPTREQ